MEANENPLSPYFRLHQRHQHHHQQQSPTTASTTATIFTSSANGLLPSALHMSSPATATTADTGAHMLYPHSSSSAAVSPSPLESVRRKRGRPRKYGTPEEALAAKKAATASAHCSTSREKKHRGSSSASSASFFSESLKKSQLGNTGQGFTPHVLHVAAGEDVGQKIMLFMQQSKREMCVLSASGSISNAALRQPATSGGNIAYEGRFEIISLSGSYVQTELGGRTGGLSICLCNADGQIVGGGVGGPLKALGPVQVIVGTFQMESKKETILGEAKGNETTSKPTLSKLPSVGGLLGSSQGYRSKIEPHSRGNDDDQVMGTSHFIFQPRTADWRTGSDSNPSAGYELAGRIGLGVNQSRENGDYNQIPD